MKNKIIKKSIALLMLILTIISTFSNYAFATEINKADIQNNGDVEYHLQYWNEEKNTWSYVVTTYTTYSQNGKNYPAYCLNREFPRGRRIRWLHS